MSKLVLPTYRLALAVAAEWDRQPHKPGVFRPNLMPLMTLAASSVDEVPAKREKMLNSTLRAFTGDVVAYRVDDPPDLAAIQAETFDPILKSLEDSYGIAVNTTTTFFMPEQPAESIEIMDHFLRSLTDWQLAGYQQLTANLKSLVLSRALMNRWVSIEGAVECSQVEEYYQRAQRRGTGGFVEGMHDVDLADITLGVAGASTFLHLIDSDVEVHAEAENLDHRGLAGRSMENAKHWADRDTLA